MSWLFRLEKLLGRKTEMHILHDTLDGARRLPDVDDSSYFCVSHQGSDLLTAGSVYDTNICQIERMLATASEQPFMMGEIITNMLCITWDPAAVPEGGFLVVSSPAAFAKAVGKEPAGAPFHDYAMRQAGLIGTPTFTARFPVAHFDIVHMTPCMFPLHKSLLQIARCSQTKTSRSPIVLRCSTVLVLPDLASRQHLFSVSAQSCTIHQIAEY